MKSILVVGFGLVLSASLLIPAFGSTEWETVGNGYAPTATGSGSVGTLSGHGSNGTRTARIRRTVYVPAQVEETVTFSDQYAPGAGSTGKRAWRTPIRDSRSKWLEWRVRARERRASSGSHGN